ncbi:MAG: hypothetical protein ACLRWQ_08360 [Flavonifractor plautii]
MDDSRANGDVGVVESSSGYYAVMLLNRYRDETATADIRHILIKAEVADADDPATEDVDESKVPTQEALDARQGRGRGHPGPVGGGRQDCRVLRRAGRGILRRSRLQHQRRPV